MKEYLISLLVFKGTEDTKNRKKITTNKLQCQCLTLKPTQHVSLRKLVFTTSPHMSRNDVDMVDQYQFKNINLQNIKIKPIHNKFFYSHIFNISKNTDF